jgi:hypothetical protein
MIETKEFLESILKECYDLGLSEKEICKKYGINYKSFYGKKKKFGLVKFTRGLNPNCRTKKNTYNCNEDYFSVVCSENSYWAGFLAADGNISRNNKSLAFGLKTSDIKTIEEFKLALSSESIIKNHVKKLNGKTYYFSDIFITSKKLCEDLTKNFNITNKKSLTLMPPKINDCFLDYYIKGYIDGDGSICEYTRKKNSLTEIRISMLGTLEVLTCIKNRFLKILNKKDGIYLCKKDPNKDGKIKNTWSLHMSLSSSVEIFKYYYNLDYGIDRKWKKEFYDYCVNYADRRCSKKDEIKIRVIDLIKTNSKKEVAKIVGYTEQGIHKMINSKRYIYLKSCLDTGISDMETEESE